MKIGIVGSNCHGLSFALLCERKGYEVSLTGTDEDFLFNLNNKICLDSETDIQRILLESKKLTTTNDRLEIIKESDLIFSFIEIQVNVDGTYDSSSLFELTNDFFTLSSLNIPIHKKKFVICSSTNPGDVDQIQKKLNMFNIQVAYNPHFIEENKITKSLEESETLIIGTEYQELANELIQLYKKIQTKDVNTFVMSIKSAEITKLSINSYKALKSCFASVIGDILIKSNLRNELDIVLSTLGFNLNIGKKGLEYGFGFGGPVIPKDNKVLGIYIDQLKLDNNLPNSISELNDKHLDLIKEYFTTQNPDKSNPFVINHLSNTKDSTNLEESQKLKLCLHFLDQGYYVNVIESNKVSERLNKLSESYEGRLKFFSPNTKPEGFLIKL